MGTSNSKLHDELIAACRERPAPRIDRIRSLIEEYPKLVEIVRKDRTRGNVGNIPWTYDIWRSGSLELITFLVQTWPESIREKLSGGETLLHVAVRVVSPRSLAIVQFLVNLWPESVKEQTKNGALPLHRAVHCGGDTRLDIVVFLVEQWKGSLTVPNTIGCLPIHTAIVESAPPEVIRYLAEQCPESLRMWIPGKISNYQALHVAVIHHLRNGYVDLLEVVQMLMEIWPDSIRQTTSNGMLPLHFAAWTGCPIEIIEALTKPWPESAMEVDGNGDLPLHLELHEHYTGYYARPEVVTHLVKLCPESVTKKNIAGLLPIQLTTKQWFYKPELREEVLFQLVDQQFAIHFVCQYYDYFTWNIFERVLQHQPGAVVQRDVHGYLPWQAASLRSDNTLPLSVLFCLLRACPDTIRLADTPNLHDPITWWTNLDRALNAASTFLSIRAILA